MLVSRLLCRDSLRSAPRLCKQTILSVFASLPDHIALRVARWCPGLNVAGKLGKDLICHNQLRMFLPGTLSHSPAGFCSTSSITEIGAEGPSIVQHQKQAAAVFLYILIASFTGCEYDPCDIAWPSRDINRNSQGAGRTETISMHGGPSNLEQITTAQFLGKQGHLDKPLMWEMRLRPSQSSCSPVSASTPVRSLILFDPNSSSRRFVNCCTACAFPLESEEPTSPPTRSLETHYNRCRLLLSQGCPLLAPVSFMASAAFPGLFNRDACKILVCA